MPALKNAKQEKFVQNLIKGMSQRQAYRDAYPSSQRWKDKVVDNKASLLFNGEILVRYQEIQEEQKNATLMTRWEKRKILADIARDRENDAADRIRSIDTDNRMEGEYNKQVENKDALDKLDEALKKIGGVTNNA